MYLKDNIPCRGILMQSLIKTFQKKHMILLFLFFKLMLVNIFIIFYFAIASNADYSLLLNNFIAFCAGIFLLQDVFHLLLISFLKSDSKTELLFVNLVMIIFLWLFFYVFHSETLIVFLNSLCLLIGVIFFNFEKVK